MNKQQLIEVCLRCIQAYSTEKEWTIYSKICQKRLERLTVQILQYYLDHYNPRGMIKDDVLSYSEASTVDSLEYCDYCKNVFERYKKDRSILDEVRSFYRK